MHKHIFMHKQRYIFNFLSTTALCFTFIIFFIFIFFFKLNHFFFAAHSLIYIIYLLHSYYLILRVFSKSVIILLENILFSNQRLYLCFQLFLRISEYSLKILLYFLFWL